ncbi:MAG TPA: protein phosphatase 2C domain-containing protein [Limnochordales bacterium]
MDVGLASGRGAARERNEDACAADQGFLAVADGMGGHRAGEVAAALALACVRQPLPARRAAREAVRELFDQAHRTIQEQALLHADRRGMGTTLTALWVVDGRAVVGHVGDSRAYLVRQGVAHQLTQDHSVAAELVRNGTLTQEEAWHHPHRHVLTRSLGGPEPVTVDVVEVALQPGDRLVLCTDGVSAVVRDGELAQVVQSCTSAQQAACSLVELARARGSRDDMTVAVAFIDAGDVGGQVAGGFGQVDEGGSGQ